jgi:hypothetical protein
MSVAYESLCYMCIRIHIYISVAHLGKNRPSTSCTLVTSVAKCTQQSLSFSLVNSNICNTNSLPTASIFLSLTGHAEKMKACSFSFHFLSYADCPSSVYSALLSLMYYLSINISKYIFCPQRLFIFFLCF